MRYAIIFPDQDVIRLSEHATEEQALALCGDPNDMEVVARTSASTTGPSGTSEQTAVVCIRQPGGERWRLFTGQVWAVPITIIDRAQTAGWEVSGTEQSDVVFQRDNETLTVDPMGHVNGRDAELERALGL
ncbi:hypothetical protein [Larsenimonas rhizosphaerae]|uniref:Uncharacterized protein n=1 Tax=Larsenimonas rhizosphaerae TaxID=2944682 RepID=A0AA42CUE2_9GAMM|nr:hypothetical protein [Larsenimonas rhizosphaerae]MCM2129566.1 hypothetical protein [Larsenimonas rhizosphaerae]MCX2524224.1 hypothetical protein [Larsenimonas rhizosphaerae]